MVLSSAETTLLDKLIDFLQSFADSTKQLEGELYVTMDLSVIIREQLYVHLEFKKDDHAVIKQVKALMLNKWDDIMPLQGLRVVAAYLNPALRNVKSIQEFIEANGLAYQVLKNIAEEMNIRLELENTGHTTRLSGQTGDQDNDPNSVAEPPSKLNVSNSWRNY